MEKRTLRGSYKIAHLIYKHLDKSITPAENKLLQKWLHEKEANQELFQQLIKKEQINQAITRLIQIEAEKKAAFPHIFNQLTQPVAPDPPPPHSRKWAYAIAATILLCISTATLIYLNRQTGDTNSRTGVAAHFKNDIPPGNNKATLTLADGTVIALDSAQNGALAQQGNTKIIKLDSGRLAYEGLAGTAKPEALYNTIFTPRGGQYQVMLPDGSRVWLNAASSLRFPTVFSSKERKVQLSGEVYFEIAPLYTKRKKKVPFIVEVISPSSAVTGRITVLGTHFNVMAYDDEKAVEITLLEGAIQVTKGQSGTGTPLQPGQQAQLDKQGALNVQPDTDLAAVMAWKNGMFQFHHADLPTVLRQLSRWYDVDVEYKGAIPVREFEGEIQRDLSLSQVLRILGKNQVHISIEGKKMVVMP